MIELDTVRRKPLTVNQDGEMVLDITARVTGFDGFVKIDKTVIVSEEMNMRPDNVAKAAMGSMNQLDYLLKYNNIDNPFSLGDGIVLAVPDQSSISPLATPVDAVMPDIRDRLTDPDRMSKKDKQRLDFVKRMAAKDPAGTREVLTPNMAPKGSKEITEEGGKVTFGKDVTSTNPAACEPKSKAELKARLLQKKMFGDK